MISLSYIVEWYGKLEMEKVLDSGANPWAGIQQSHILLGQLVLLLQQKGIFHLNQIADITLTNIWHQGWMGI